MKRSLGIFPDIPTLPSRSSSSTNIISHSDSDSRDYHGLEHALKRVRISASPGQLRLENDLQSLVLHHSWTELLEDGSMDSAYNDYKHQNLPMSAFNDLISSTQLHQLRRDATDPLRLTLSLWFPSMTTRHRNSCSIKWIYHIQIPRMYPHSPPLIHRITKSVVGEKGQELYRLTSDLTNDSFTEYWNNAHIDFHDLNDNRVSVEVASRAQSPCVTVWVSQAWENHDQRQYIEFLEREKAWMLTAILISSRNSNIEPRQALIYRLVEESTESDQDKKVSCLLYNKNPYRNMAAFQDWSPILQLSDFIALLLNISREWEEVAGTNHSIPSCSLPL